MIFLPYVGRVRAIGKTTEQLRLLIERKLKEQTPDPQIIIRKTPGTGANISVAGSVVAQGVYPIENANRKLSGLLAQAGGLAISADTARISIKRGNSQTSIWANDLYDSTSTDIAMRPGDRVFVKEDPRQFIALGSLGGQTVVPFDRDQISLLEAIGMVGGLDSRASNPSGVFVFRKERAGTIQKLRSVTPMVTNPRIVYALDMKNPESMFAGSEFYVRDDDVIYVTEAPFTQISKVVQAITGTAGSIQSTTALAQ